MSRYDTVEKPFNKRLAAGLLLALALVVALSPRPARADGAEAVAAVIVGAAILSAIADDDHHGHTYVSYHFHDGSHRRCYDHHPSAYNYHFHEGSHRRCYVRHQVVYRRPYYGHDSHYHRSYRYGGREYRHDYRQDYRAGYRDGYDRGHDDHQGNDNRGGGKHYGKGYGKGRDKERGDDRRWNTRVTIH